MAKILLVMEDGRRRKSCLEALQKHGYTVEAVESTESAMRRLHHPSKNYELILCDKSNLQKLDNTMAISRESTVIPLLLVHSQEETESGIHARLLDMMSKESTSPVIGGIAESELADAASFQAAMGAAIEAGERKANQAKRLGGR